MVSAGAADDFESYMILPEVKDPKNWWGGHIWEDNLSTKRYIYTFFVTPARPFGITQVRSSSRRFALLKIC